MRNLFNLTKIACIAITFLNVLSCVDDDDNGNIIDNSIPNSIVDFVINNEDYSTLLTALNQTDLTTILAGAGTFTVFAPNNEAFDSFLGGTAIEDVDNDLLTQVLLNHVLGIEVTSDQLSTGYFKNLASEISTGVNLDMFVDTTNGVVINGQSAVTTADIEVDNGVIHAVDNVISLPTVATFATTNPTFSSLVAALTDEGNTSFTDLLSDTEQDFTVFAPTNDAFASFLDGAALSDIDNDDLAQLLFNHVLVDSIALSNTLTNSYINTAAIFNGDSDTPLSLYINTDSGVSLNGISNVALADIVATNGVVHVVDAVIGLPDITTFATADPNFSSLVAALTADASFGYVEALQTPNGTAPAPFTVFAPVNSAFDSLLADLELTDLSEIDTAVLAATLELHVVTGSNVRAEDLPGLDGAIVTTLGGTDITIQASPAAIIDPDGGENSIILTDVQATNGVIHATSRVLRDL